MMMKLLIKLQDLQVLRMQVLSLVSHASGRGGMCLASGRGRELHAGVVLKVSKKNTKKMNKIIKYVADESHDDGDVFTRQTLATNIGGDLQDGEAPEEALSESGVSIFRDKRKDSHSKGIIKQS